MSDEIKRPASRTGHGTPVQPGRFHILTTSSAPRRVAHPGRAAMTMLRHADALEAGHATRLSPGRRRSGKG